MHTPDGVARLMMNDPLPDFEFRATPPQRAAPEGGELVVRLHLRTSRASITDASGARLQVGARACPSAPACVRA